MFNYKHFITFFWVINEYLFLHHTSRNNCSCSLEITYGLKYFQSLFYFSKLKSGHELYYVFWFKNKRFLLTVSSVTMQGKYVKENQQLCLRTFCHGDQYPLFLFCFFFGGGAFEQQCLLQLKTKNALRHFIDRPNKIIFVSLF